jgi:hypothetical protein
MDAVSASAKSGSYYFVSDPLATRNSREALRCGEGLHEGSSRNFDPHSRVPFADLLTTLCSQAGGSNAPTLASIYCLWLPELVRDAIVTETPEADAVEIKKDWSESAVSAATVSGKIYGYPNEIDLYALNYNQELFAAAGITGPSFRDGRPSGLDGHSSLKPVGCGGVFPAPRQ